MQWFHALLCDKLQAFAEGKIKKLMVLMPPQHGKSELTTRLFPGYLLGRNPELKIVMATYSQTIASNFNRSMQRYIDTEEYDKIFPGTKLNLSQIFKTNVDGYTRTTEKFDVIKHKGSVKTVGVGGSLTSEPADVVIIDDPLKDREEANSETIRTKLYEWYTDVVKTRMHNGSQQLIIQTRWHEKDLAGRLLEEDNDWDIVKLPAIKTKEVQVYDTRQVGAALWPGKHSLERLLEVKQKNEVTFNSLYQQNPRPNTEILVYKDWVQLQQWPEGLQDVSWGLDFGKTTGINALVKGCITSEITYKDAVDADGVAFKKPCHNAYLQEYLYRANVSPLQIAELLKASGYIEGQIVWCDHMPMKWGELRQYGIAAYPAVKGPGSVTSGIDKMNELQVFYLGANIKMESDLYQYVTYDNVITNVPVDENNHALDAARYCLLSRFFREGK